MTKTKMQQLGKHRDFEIINRPSGFIWMHKTQPVWIVHYDALEGVRAEFFQGYRAVRPAKNGTEPWCVDNRRIGTDSGFRTLQDAFIASEQCNG